MKFMQKKLNKKGFTLVELIIVLAVLAILAAIVVPRMSGITGAFRERADGAVCENYAREIEISVQIGEVGISDFGEVSDVIDEVEIPQSNSAAVYYYVVNGGTVTVYAGTTAPTTNSVPAAGVIVQESRDNAVVID